MPASQSARALERNAEPLGFSLLEGVDPEWWAAFCAVELEIVNRDPGLQRIELEICARSRPYFLQRYYFVAHKVQRRPTRLLFSPPQITYINSETLDDDILKSRKLGFSTLIGAEMFHLCRFTPTRHGMVIAHESKATEELFKKQKYAMKRLPEWMRPPLSRDNTREILFQDIDSQIQIGTAGNTEVGRGSDIDFLHLSEIASFPNLEETLAAVGEALTPIGRIVKESTAKGFNAWRDECMDALYGRNDAKLHVFPWWTHPANRIPLEDGQAIVPDKDEAALISAHALDDEQINFRRKKKKKLKGLLQQEQLENGISCFLQSGQPKFDQAVLSRLLVVVEARVRPLDLDAVIPADFRLAGKLRAAAEMLEIWVPPKPKHRYLIAADVAGGGGGDADFSYAEVLDVTRKDAIEQVAMARSNEIRPGPWGRFLAVLGWFYNEAMVAPEENNHGHATLFALQEEGYWNLYYHLDPVTGEEKDRPGFPTNVGTRNQILDMLGECLSTGGMVVRDATMIRECLTFQVGDEVDRRANAVEIKKRSVKRDGVLTNAIGWYVAQIPTPTVL